MESRAGVRAARRRETGVTADLFRGPVVVREKPRAPVKSSVGRAVRTVAAILAAGVLVLSFIASVQIPAKKVGELQASTESVVTLPLNLITQYRDTNMPCIPDGASCPPGGGPHPWNDAKGPDGVYGTGDDCPHCSCYCAPASIAMISTFRGNVGPKIQQDDIYDSGKSVGEVAVGDGILSTHGIGMFDGTGGLAIEVQTSFFWAVGPFTQHDWVPANPNGPMTSAKLVQYLAFGHPVLWLDHGGFPKNQSPNFPPITDRQFEGHAKVIAGYDDNDTLLNTSDDLCLIYDPWPEYSDLSILPSNATMGPGGTYDPYWLPLNDVNLTDVADIYLVDNFPDIPEFQGILIPVSCIGLAAIVCAASVFRKRR